MWAFHCNVASVFLFTHFIPPPACPCTLFLQLALLTKEDEIEADFEEKVGTWEASQSHRRYIHSYLRVLSNIPPLPLPPSPLSPPFYLNSLSPPFSPPSISPLFSLPSLSLPIPSPPSLLSPFPPSPLLPTTPNGLISPSVLSFAPEVVVVCELPSCRLKRPYPHVCSLSGLTPASLTVPGW